MIKNNRYEIYTPNGFKDFSGIRKLQKDKYFNIILSNGKHLKCSVTHPFIYNGAEIFANTLKVGSVIDSNGSQEVIVEFIELKSGIIDLYDIVNVADGNIFCVDGIVSHNCDFTTSGNTVIDPLILKWYWEESGRVYDPIEKRGFDANLWVWKYPEAGKSYIVVADVARGDAADYSSFHVIDVESVEQCASYKGKLNPKDYGNFLVAIATEYNDALLVIENSNIGWAAVQPAIDRGYANLFYSSADLTTVDVQQQISSGYDLATKSKMTPGFSQTTRNRPLIISKLVEYFRDRSPIIHCKRTISELQNFIWNSSRPEAQYGYNDDLVISLAIALWVRDTALKLRQQGLDLQRKTLGLVGKSLPVYNATSNSAYQSQWSMKAGKESEDISWLL
jgi:hypothetical protein